MAVADPFIDSRAMVALSRLLTERNAAFLELDAVRADLREAVELLRTSAGPGYRTWLHLEDATDWNTRYGALLAKHKETP